MSQNHIMLRGHVSTCCLSKKGFYPLISLCREVCTCGCERGGGQVRMVTHRNRMKKCFYFPYYICLFI